MKDSSLPSRGAQSLLGTLLLLAGITAAHGADTYAAGHLTIPHVSSGSASYSDMVVTVAGILSGPSTTAPTFGFSRDTYNPSNNQLTIPVVTVGTTTFYSVVVSVGALVSIGGAVGIDVYNGASLTIPYVQVGSATYSNAVITVSSIVSLGGGMPNGSADQYNAANGQLSIPAVMAGGKIYTNVLVKVGHVLSVGSHGISGDSPTPMVASGETHTCALNSAGHVYCWGANDNGEIGNGTIGSTRVTAPVEVPGLSGITSISSGWYGTCAVTNVHGAWCWGLAAQGWGSSQIVNTTLPWQVANATGSGPLTGVAAISTGGYVFTCALTTSQTVLCWGTNAQGQLGNNYLVPSTNLPMEVPNLSGVTQIATGYQHACALTALGAVWCWGDDKYGELGDGRTNSQSGVPIQVAGLPTGIIQVAAGWYDTCVMTNSGAMWCWGYNASIGLANPGIETLIPQQVPGLASGGTALSTIAYHICAQIGGGMQCWGLEGLGLGNNVPDSSLVPATVVNPGGSGPLGQVASISVGDSFTCAVVNNAGIVGVDCWGLNSAGQLGNGTFDSIPKPSQSTPPAPVVGLGGAGFLQL